LSKKYKKVILVVCTLFIVGLVTFIYTNIDFISYKSAKPVLSKYGSSGQEVISIQTKLSSLGYYKGAIDGKYGPLTYSAVRKFQAARGLVVDGIAGPKTLAALGISTSSPSALATTANINLIAHLIYAEARGEIYTGQVAVGSVIVNRVRDSRFPSTVAGVIYQPGAFTPVANGQINLSPNSTAINAARDALNGWDPSYGAIYFYNPATSTSKWILSRPITVVIGHHAFAK